MIVRRQALRLLGGLVLLPAAAERAAAAQLEFVPITIEAPMGPFASTIDVINRGGGSSVLQVRAFSWQQNGDEPDALIRSDAIVVSPPMFTLPDGETQTIRVVLRTVPGPIEQAFRIAIDEIPAPQAQALQFALRVSLPVFAGPPDAKADLQWRVTRGDGDRLMVTAQNTGQRRARVTKVSLALPGAAPVDGRLEQKIPYVLAGARRRWLVPMPAVRVGGQVRLTADTDTKTVALSLPVET